MSSSPPLRLPRAAPFDAEQIAALDRVIGAANAVQRAWLAGFLAGVDAAQGPGAAAGAPAAAPAAARPPLLILYATESGNAEALAAKAKASAAKRGFAARTLDMAEAKPAILTEARHLLVIASTWGDGEPPQRAAPFYRALMADGAPRLEGLRYAVLALGDSAYAQFCETGKRIDARLAALGAARAAPLVEADVDYEAPAQSWLGSALEALAPTAEQGAVIHVEFAKPAASANTATAVTVAAHHPLTSSRAEGVTVHLEFDLAGSGLAYEPGDALAIQPRNAPELAAAIASAAGVSDAATIAALETQFDITTLTPKQLESYAAQSGAPALATAADRAAFLAGRQWLDLLEAFPHRFTPAEFLGLLRPLQPRYYSLASSMRLVGEEAHIAVARVAYESAGRARLGVASSYLTDRLGVGGTVSAFIKPNPHFRLPADPATPIIMVGAGTGIAPYRGFLQEREARGTPGEAWLIFGHRHFLHDFLYQLEIQAWLASGVLTRLDLAASRDQPEKRYVQHVLWEERAALTARLKAGAVLYLCGDAKAMARDVDAVLAKILGQDELDALIAAGRYRKDVY